MPEKAFMAQIIEAAEWLGFMAYHPFDSRKSVPGYPDLTLVGKPGGTNAGRLLFIELKRETGRYSDSQLVWLGALMACDGVETYTWRPRDVDAALAILQARPA